MNIVNKRFTEQEVLYGINNLNINSSMAFDFVLLSAIVLHVCLVCMTCQHVLTKSSDILLDQPRYMQRHSNGPNSSFWE